MCRLKHWLWGGGLALALLVFWACAPQMQQGGPSSGVSPAQAGQKREAVRSYYTQKLTPLTPAECGRCHYSIYKSLQEHGGKHSGVLCTQCHKVYHVYNPQKKNWSQIMPKCQRCHNYPHGEALANCEQCHVNPHAPKEIPLAAVENRCSECHPGPAGELKEFPSKHTEVGCTGCHEEKHGYIPDCSACHEPHVKGQKMADCLKCHPVHSPTRISYSVDTPNNVCGACHETEFEHLKERVTKHSALTCAKCHPKHGEILSCSKCHGYPHSPAIHKRFPKCIQCHIDPHYLPTKPGVAAGSGK